MSIGIFLIIYSLSDPRTQCVRGWYQLGPQAGKRRREENSLIPINYDDRKKGCDRNTKVEGTTVKSTQHAHGKDGNKKKTTTANCQLTVRNQEAEVLERRLHNQQHSRPPCRSPVCQSLDAKHRPSGRSILHLHSTAESGTFSPSQLRDFL